MTKTEALQALREAEVDREVIVTLRDGLRERAAEFRTLREDVRDLRRRLRNRERQLDQLLDRAEEAIELRSELSKTRAILPSADRELAREMIRSNRQVARLLQGVIDAAPAG